MNIWNLFKDMENIQQQLGDISHLRNIPNLSFSSRASNQRFPLVNISDNEEETLIEALAPGLNVESLKVSATRDELKISGERVLENTEKGKFYKRERAVHEFSRTIELPFPINPDGINAEYKNGMLTISLPKVEEIKPKQIEIKLS